MTIHRLIQTLAFNQDDIERLAAAYEGALHALHISDRDDPLNKVIAQRIIEGAAWAGATLMICGAKYEGACFDGEVGQCGGSEGEPCGPSEKHRHSV